MLKPSDPLRITFPVPTGTSLKNDRDLIQVKAMVKGKIKLVPKLVVGKNTVKVMNNMKAAITRQLNQAFNHAWDGAIADQGFAMVSFIYVFYKSQFPRSDIDNFHTTFQECLQERLMHDDRQIEYFTPVRRRVSKKEHEYIDSYLWITEGDFVKEQRQFLDYYERTSNEYRRLEPSAGSAGHSEDESGTTEIVSWF